ncbi:MAG: hypothetical protein K5655_07175 [Lachnospiraceae bacterium]|nr:hypothetical protein [Lachnospiraceae bacterium]
MDWGLVLMLVALAATVATFVIFGRQNKESENTNGSGFDERQVLYRGKAFKYSFIVMSVYYALYAVIVSLCGEGFGSEELMIFIGLEIGLVFCYVYCILHDAFVAVNRSFAFIVILDLICLIIQLVSYFRERAEGALLVENGKLTSTGLPLSLAVSFGVILIALLVRKHYQKKEEREEA